MTDGAVVLLANMSDVKKLNQSADTLLKESMTFIDDLTERCATRDDDGERLKETQDELRQKMTEHFSKTIDPVDMSDIVHESVAAKDAQIGSLVKQLEEATAQTTKTLTYEERVQETLRLRAEHQQKRNELMDKLRGEVRELKRVLNERKSKAEFHVARREVGKETGLWLTDNLYEKALQFFAKNTEIEWSVEAAKKELVRIRLMMSILIPSRAKLVAKIVEDDRRARALAEVDDVSKDQETDTRPAAKKRRAFGVLTSRTAAKNRMAKNSSVEAGEGTAVASAPPDPAKSKQVATKEEEPHKREEREFVESMTNTVGALHISEADKVRFPPDTPAARRRALREWFVEALSIMLGMLPMEWGVMYTNFAEVKLHRIKKEVGEDIVQAFFGRTADFTEEQFEQKGSPPFVIEKKARLYAIRMEEIKHQLHVLNLRLTNMPEDGVEFPDVVAGYEKKKPEDEEKTKNAKAYMSRTSKQQKTRAAAQNNAVLMRQREQLPKLRVVIRKRDKQLERAKLVCNKMRVCVDAWDSGKLQGSILKRARGVLRKQIAAYFQKTIGDPEEEAKERADAFAAEFGEALLSDLKEKEIIPPPLPPQEGDDKDIDFPEEDTDYDGEEQDDWKEEEEKPKRERNAPKKGAASKKAKAGEPSSSNAPIDDAGDGGDGE